MMQLTYCAEAIPQPTAFVADDEGVCD